MREHIATTPFGRRPLTLGQIAARLQADAAVEEAGKPGSNLPAAAHKWKLFRTITEAKSELGVSDRSLSVLNALLTFHPETALSLPVPIAADDDGEGEGRRPTLVVFPSNRELSLRAHGVGERSLARHLASLVAAGLILRRDSPNGKRYARRARDGAGGFAEAFGFDLTPLVARAAEFEAIAERLRRERQRMQMLRERISLHRRDIAKMIECALLEEIAGDWDGYSQQLLGFSGPLRRIHDAASLANLEGELSALREIVAAALEAHVRTEPTVSAESKKESGNDGHRDGQYHNSNTHNQNFEPASEEARAISETDLEEADNRPSIDPSHPTPTFASSQKGTPLGMVLDACPDISDWSPDPVRNWRDFLRAAQLARSALGISPSAWQDAMAAMGEIDAAIAVASILQRHESSSDAVAVPSPSGGSPRTTVHGSPAIMSAGGYLRALTDKARAGEFSVGPILMALIGQRGKHRRIAK